MKIRARTNCNANFDMLNLLLLKNSGESYCYNKNTGVNCTKHNLAVALLDSVCSMQKDPCVRFFVSTRSKIRAVVTSRNTEDIRTFSCDGLFFFT